MQSQPRLDYDLAELEPEEININIEEWLFQSSINPKIVYKLVEKDPVEFFDFRQRYIV
jgi:hypothetical protein